jgi:hypothetical protein
MNRIVVFVSIFTFAIAGYAQDKRYAEIRRIYSEGLNLSGVAKLISAVNNFKLATKPLGMAYLGTANCSSAGEESSPLGKLRKFNQGKDLLENAVAGEPLDGEIRFLRMATRIMSPAFLGYKGDIENDKKLILLTFYLVEPNHPNSYFYRQICAFMQDHSELTPDELAKAKDLQTKLSKNDRRESNTC